MLTTLRDYYAPFEYEKAYEYWMKQQYSHWIPQEVSMTKDIQDWHTNLNAQEKNIIINTLKSFTQTELIVEDYWSTKIQSWFPKPEIKMMAVTFGAAESIHTIGYAYLNESLGILDFESFLSVPSAKAKIDRLLHVEDNDPSGIARSLAIFSGFTEGVSLFSSFAILYNYSRYNKMKGIKEIISWSVLDELLHSEAGCWLFRTYIDENPQLWTDDLKSSIYEGARETVKLEDSFIDMVFEDNYLEGLDPEDLKQFIRYRANLKLNELKLKSNWKNINQDSLNRLEWFEVLTQGVRRQDFFDGKVTEYSKSKMNFNEAWAKYETRN